MYISSIYRYYESRDVAERILFHFVEQAFTEVAITVIYNYELSCGELVETIEQLMLANLFAGCQFEMAHYGLKNERIADYNANGVCTAVDELERFEESLSFFYKINDINHFQQSLVWKVLEKGKLREEFIDTSRKDTKRNNYFYEIKIGQKGKLVLLVLPKGKEGGLAKHEQREIENLLILQKGKVLFENAKGINEPKSFLGQILARHLSNSQVNILVSAYPSNRSFEEAINLHLKISSKRAPISLESNSTEKQIEIDKEVEKLKLKLRQQQCKIKAEDEEINKLTKTYTKAFSRTFSSIEYLKQGGITNISQRINWLKNEKTSIEGQISEQERILKSLREEMIVMDLEHKYYVDKVMKCKASLDDNLSEDQLKEKENAEPDEDELLYYYDPEKQQSAYKQRKYEDMKKRLQKSSEYCQFLSELKQVKDRMSDEEYSEIEEHYYDLISL